MIREFVLRLGDDCLAPLRVYLTVAAAGFGHLALGSLYLRASRDRVERQRRAIVVIFGLCALSGAAFLASCVSVCATSPPCPRSYDLNCNGENPVFYQLGAVVLVAAWFVAALWELGMRLSCRKIDRVG